MVSRPDYPQLASDLLEEHWGERAELSRLPGENLNFQANLPDGTCQIFKITTNDKSDVELEEAMLKHLLSAGFPVPESSPSRAGQVAVPVTIAGIPGIARVQRGSGGVGHPRSGRRDVL